MPALRPPGLAVIALMLSATANAAEYAIARYDLRLEPEFADRSLHESAALHIHNPSLQQAFEFLLNARYRITRVTAEGQPVEIVRDGESLTVKIPRPWERFTLRFDIRATPGRSLDEDRDVITANDLFLLWSDRFYPVDFERWSQVETKIILPAGFQAIAPGRLRRARRRRDKVEYTFTTRQPAVAFSVFADRRWVRTVRRVGGRKLQTLLFPASQTYAGRILKSSADVLQFFTALHGSCPFDQFSFVTLEGIYARRAFNGFIGYSPEFLKEEMESTGYDAHETSLLWWFGATRGRGPGAWQWTEGLADYMEFLYGEARGKPLPREFVYYRRQYLKLPPAQDAGISQIRGNTDPSVIHGRLPWTMAVLRESIGDAKFRAGLQLLFRRYAWRSFTLDDLVAAFSQAAGESVAWWREQWLDRPGVPTLTLATTTRLERGQYLVQGVVEQTGSQYRVPLTIGIRTPDGWQLQRLTITKPHNPFVFHIPKSPLEIRLDPEQRLLLRVVAEP